MTVPGPSFLFRKGAAASRPAADGGRIGIIDIGSNSVRLVVYDAAARIPSILFNEKVMAGLGRGLAQTGALDAAAAGRALAALQRFVHIARQIEVESLRTVATAAVRDASNGPQFLAELQAMGLDVELLSGPDEALISGEGVLAGIPGADGIVGDLGGGSLELVRVAGGAVHDCASFPLGVLRLAAIRKQGPRALSKVVADALAAAPWAAKAGRGRPFYMVGGSWRALARLDMQLTGYPLPILHHYEMDPIAPARLMRSLAQIDRKRLKEMTALSSARVPTLPDAAALLSQIARGLGSSTLIVSAFGLREGVLHRSLEPHVRNDDPLLFATREEGRRQGRFPEHGDLLQRWIAPLFEGEAAPLARLRHATCLLADVGWRANPEFRAERGLETALHGNWVGIDARGRAMMAHALYTSFGGEGETKVVAALLSPEERARAARWGLAMRLGQRLSAGVAPPLEASRVALAAGRLELLLRRQDAPLYGESVERRHRALAVAFAAEPALVLG